MRTLSSLMGLLIFLFTSAADAHFRFLSPDGGSIDWLKVESNGDPVGGTQKTHPCGAGTQPTGVVTTLTAGQTYGIRIDETVFHEGHYRVALAQDAGSIPAPEAAPDCSKRTVPPVVAPVLLDGALQHTTPFGAPRIINITVPTKPCTGCWLQVAQFMTPHSPPCFYYHCARVNIVAAGGGAGGGGGSGGGSASGGGSGGGDIGTGGESGGEGGGDGTGGSAAGGGSVTDAGNSDGGMNQPNPPTGCGCTSAWDPLWICAALILVRSARRNRARESSVSC